MSFYVKHIKSKYRWSADLLILIIHCIIYNVRFGLVYAITVRWFKENWVIYSGTVILIWNFVGLGATQNVFILFYVSIKEGMNRIWWRRRSFPYYFGGNLNSTLIDVYSNFLFFGVWNVQQNRNLKLNFTSK